MAESSIIKQPTYTTTNLLSWGTHGTKNETIDLLDSLDKFDYIRVQISADSSQTSGGGPQYVHVPKYTLNAGDMFGCPYCLNGKIYFLSVQIVTMTQLKIIAAYNYTDNTEGVVAGIRQITGIKFG